MGDTTNADPFHEQNVRVMALDLAIRHHNGVSTGNTETVATAEAFLTFLQTKPVTNNAN